MIPARDSIKTLAALHELDGEHRVVVAAVSSGAPEPVVTKSATFPVAGGTASLADFLDEADVDLLIRVVPSARTIVRTVAAPDAADARAVADALALAAEGELPLTLPGHRRAAGTIAPGRRGSKSVGLLTGWPVRADDAGPPWRQVWSGPQVGIAEIAALAALSTQLGGVQVAAVVDPARGAVGVIGVGAERTAARVARVVSASARSAVDASADVIQDTAASVGLNLSLSGVEPGVFLEPRPSSAEIGGAVRDRAWVRSFGVAFGALTTWADPTPSVHALAALYQSEPLTKPPLPIRVTRWLGQPVRAGIVLAACLAIILALPFGVAWARVKTLEKAVPDPAALQTRNDQAEKELAFYRLLAEKRWPMTKVLADVAGATPVGIVLETVEMGQGEGLTLRGKAESAEQVTVLRENLNKLKFLDQVTTPSTSPTDGGVQFQLTARIQPGRALASVPPIDDFAGRPLVERLYGAKAGSSSANDRRAGRGSERSASSSRDRSRTGAASSSSGRPSGSSSSRSERTDRGASSTATPSGEKKPPEIPPALTDAQIAKMNATQAMLEWTRRHKAATQAGLDEATKRRLTEEAEKTKRRMQEARQQSSGGGA